jgi:hypothetical protein
MGYKAVIFYNSEVDDFNEGITGEYGNSWIFKLEAKSFRELMEEVCLYVNADSPSDLYFDDINEYKDASEAWFDYHANEENYEASQTEIELWKQGKKKLWNVSCHIIISEVSEKKFDIQAKMDTYFFKKSTEHTSKV